MKTCKICQRMLDVSRFYRKAASKDGLQAACKDCHNARVKRCVEKNPQKYKDAMANWKSKNPNRCAEHQLKYRATNRDAFRERRKVKADADRYNPLTRPKVLARQRVKSAIRRGTMARQPCQMCGANENIHAHHEDYSRPLEVTWLCHACHVIQHGGRPILTRTPGKEASVDPGNG